MTIKDMIFIMEISVTFIAFALNVINIMQLVKKQKELAKIIKKKKECGLND